MTIVGHDALRTEVDARLYDGQSPEAVAGYLRHHRTGLPHTSKDSVYRYIASVYGRRIETYRLRTKSRRHARRAKTAALANRTFIADRPTRINTRKGIGHTEADFIVSGKSGRGILLVVVDRKARVTFLENVLPVTIERVEQAFLRVRERYLELRTLTIDNDLLFAKHERLATLLGVRIFFCHPYHSWEKGTVENTNKVIRRDIPKGSDLSRYSKRFIERLEQKLNRRPMKCLNYHTPREVLEGYRKRRKHTRKTKNTARRGVS